MPGEYVFATGIQWAEATDIAKPPTMHKAAPIIWNYVAQMPIALRLRNPAVEIVYEPELVGRSTPKP